MKEKLYNFLPFVALVLGLVLTFFFSRNEYRHHVQSQRNYYEEETIRIKQQVKSRLQTYVDEQVAGAAFVIGSESVSRTEWQKFVEALKLDVNYPGINGLGLAVPVLRKDSLAFVKAMRQEIAPDFAITSLGKVPGAKDFFVVKYLDPVARNREALGFDMGSEPTRRSAMQEARDTGKPIISGMVSLVQDQSQTAGFLIYVPIFKSDKITGRLQFVGWSMAPFVVNNFINGILYHELNKNKAERPYEIELYDGATAENGNLMFKSWKTKPEKPDINYDAMFPVYGKSWTLRLVPLADTFESKYQKLAFVILFGGILLSVLFFLFLRAQANTRHKAVELARKMTMELRELNQSLDRKVAERTEELAAKNKQLSHYAENLKVAYEDLEVKVKFRNLQLEKQVKALQEENQHLKNQNG